MKKKAYIKPEMEIVELRQAVTLMEPSFDQYGMNKRVVEDEETDEGW
jgi:hypothetical protein